MPATTGFKLQPTDLQIILIAYELHVVTVELFATLTGRSPIALWRRLRKLCKEHYLRIVAEYDDRYVFSLGSAGVDALVEARLAPPELKEKRRREHELREFGIKHALFVADIRARMILLSRAGPIKIESWRQDSGIWDSVEISGRRIPVRPDAYFVLVHTERPEGRNRFHLFLEADRSTMSHKRMELKYDSYLQYYKQSLHTLKYPGMRGFVVPTITETRSRADELRKAMLPRIPYKSWREAYMFIPFEDLTIEALLPRAAAASSLTNAALPVALSADAGGRT